MQAIYLVRHLKLLFETHIHGDGWRTDRQTDSRTNRLTDRKKKRISKIVMEKPSAHIIKSKDQWSRERSPGGLVVKITIGQGNFGQSQK